MKANDCGCVECGWVGERLESGECDGCVTLAKLAPAPAITLGERLAPGCRCGGMIEWNTCRCD